MREKSEFSLNSNFFFLRESRRNKKDRTTINWIVKKRTRYKKKKRKRKKKGNRATQQRRKRNAEYESLDERDRRCVSKNRRGGKCEWNPAEIEASATGDGARVATDVDGSKSTRVATFSFRVILPPIDPRKKCIENATYQAFTIFALISYPGSQGFFMETVFPFLYSTWYILLHYARLRTEGSRSFERFPLLKSRERKSVFEKIFNKYIFHREMNVKDEPVSRIYLTNVYIFKDGHVSFIGTVERSRARACWQQVKKL